MIILNNFMKTKSIFFTRILSIWIFSFSTKNFVQTQASYLLDDTITAGTMTLVNNEPQYQLITQQSIPIPQTITTPAFIDPQIYFAITGINIISQQTSTVSWAVSCSPTSVSNDEFQFVLDKERIEFYDLQVSYLIFERDSNRRVVNGQTNFQQLINQLSPANNIVQITMPFPDRRGFTKSAEVFIIGVKLTVTFVDITINLNAYTAVGSDSYIIHFDMYSLNNRYTVETIYWNVVEFYSYPNEIIMTDSHSDYSLNPNTQMSTNFASLILAGSQLNGLVYGVQILNLRPGGTSEKGGLIITTSNTPFPISITGTCTSNTQLIIVTIYVIKFYYLSCPGQGFDGQLSDCVNTCPDGYFMKTISTDRKVCFLCDSTCRTCTGELNTSCTGCYNNQYLIGGQCLANNDFTYCNAQNECQYCDGQALNCLHCGSDLIECLTCSPNFVLTLGVCNSPPNTPDPNTPDPNSPNSNPGGTQQTTEINGTIKQSILSEETIQSTSIILEKASKTATYTSAAMTFTSGFLMLTGYPLLTQLLTTQKAFYLLLININPPQYLQEFVLSLSDKGILNQFSSFNSLSGLAADNSESKTIGNKFETEKIPSDIFINAGGGLTAVLSFAVLFVLFIILENSRLHKVGMIIYEKVACGIIVEIFQVSIFIFTFSSMMCLTNFSEIDSIQIIAIGFCFIFIAVPLIGQSILLWKYGVNNSSDLSQSVVKRVLVQKLLNECKNEKIYTRLYMVAFLTVECLIFPLIIVLARENPKVASFSMAAVQILITVLTFLIRPFVHLRETVLLLVEQVIFSGVFVAFTILAYLLEEVDDTSSSYPTSVDTTSLIISTLIGAAVMLKPLVKLFRVIIILKDIIRARMEKAKVNQKNEVNSSPQNKVKIFPSDIPTQRNMKNSTTVEPLDIIEDVQSLVNVENVKIIESLQSPATGYLSTGNRETTELTKNPRRPRSFKSRMLVQS